MKHSSSYKKLELFMLKLIINLIVLRALVVSIYSLRSSLNSSNYLTIYRPLHTSLRGRTGDRRYYDITSQSYAQLA